MYRIDSKVDKPDIAYLEAEVKRMMERGVRVDDLGNLYNRFLAEKNAIASDIQSNYGILNPNSSQQIVKYISRLDNSEIYEACCIDGKWTTNKDALGNLSLMGYQFAYDILDYRRAKKYAESIKSMMDEVQSDGRVHPTVTLSKTNRINYSAPALMNIPKPLLWHIIKPNKPGNILISADIKNQEPSILINLLNAEHLKQALQDERGLYESLFSKPFTPTAKLNLIVTDNYRTGYISNDELAELSYVPPVYYTPSAPAVVTTYYNNEQVRAIDSVNVVVKPGSSIKDVELPKSVLIETVDGNQYQVDVEWDSISDKKLENQGIVESSGRLTGLSVNCEGIYRKEFKVAWNAMTYGAGYQGVEKICKHINGKLFYNYFSTIPEFKSYKTNCRKRAEMGIQTINTYFGTVLFAGEDNPNKLQRILMDLPIQGTAADILSLLLKHANEVIKNKGLDGKLEVFYTRHDELIFEADKEWVDEIGIEKAYEIIRDITEHQVDNWIPFKVDVSEIQAGKLYIDDTEDMFE